MWSKYVLRTMSFECRLAALRSLAFASSKLNPRSARSWLSRHSAALRTMVPLCAVGASCGCVHDAALAIATGAARAETARDTAIV